LILLLSSAWLRQGVAVASKVFSFASEMVYTPHFQIWISPRVHHGFPKKVKVVIVRHGFSQLQREWLQAMDSKRAGPSLQDSGGWFVSWEPVKGAVPILVGWTVLSPYLGVCDRKFMIIHIQVFNICIQYLNIL
jgi:hypothetical protein